MNRLINGQLLELWFNNSHIYAIALVHTLYINSYISIKEITAYHNLCMFHVHVCFSLPYRMVFAVATEDSILLYDTQQPQPFAFISNIHYHQLSDITWSVYTPYMHHTGQ